MMKKNDLKKMLMVVVSACLILVSSCSKEDEGSNSGINIYYVAEGVYDPRPDQPIPEGQVEVYLSMTMPNGGASQGNVSTPYTSPTREYQPGMTLTVYAESILSYTTITVKIYRNDVLWKSNTASATGYGNYANVTVSGTL